MELEWLPTCVQVCLKHQEFAILGRFSEVGVNLVRALVHWKFYARQARKRKQENDAWKEKLISGEFANKLITRIVNRSEAQEAKKRARPPGVKQLSLNGKAANSKSAGGSGAPAVTTEAADQATTDGTPPSQSLSSKPTGAAFDDSPSTAPKPRGTRESPSRRASGAAGRSKATEQQLQGAAGRETPSRRASREQRSKTTSQDGVESVAEEELEPAGADDNEKDDSKKEPAKDGARASGKARKAENGEASDVSAEDGQPANGGPPAAESTLAAMKGGEEVKPEIRLGLPLRQRLLMNLKAIGRSNTKMPVVSRYLVRWRSKARKTRAAKAKIKAVLDMWRPQEEDKRRLRNGFEGFRTRFPRWIPPPIDPQSPFPAVRLTKDTMWARGTRNEASFVHGEPLLTTGVFTFAVRVSGVHQGMVVGVCDAAEAQATSPSQARAWGLHLTHGALYSKKQGSAAKGHLSMKQLVNLRTSEGDEENDDGTGEAEIGIEIEIEVDMDRRKIAFCKPGEHFIEAPVTLSASVRPWALLWNKGVAVLIDARAQGSGKARMTKGPSGHRAQTKSHDHPLVPLRAQPQWITDPITGEKIYFGGAKVRIPSSPRLSPKALRPDTTLYLPKHIQPGWGTAPSGAKVSVKAAGMQDEEDEAADALGALPRQQQQRATTSHGFLTPSRRIPRSPSTPGGSRASGRGPNTPASVRQYALSIRASPISPRTSRDRSITHMWDMVRYVTGVYADVHKQI